MNEILHGDCFEILPTLPESSIDAMITDPPCGETVRQNTHPTVKPIKLMSWLLTIGSRPDDVILDPFCGSGTTALACKLNHRQFVAIEREEEYCHLARARVAAIDEPQPDLLEAAA